MLYEACVILNATQTEAETEELLEKLTKLLSDDGAVIRNVAQWGRRKLAYPIDKQPNGYYAIIHFNLESAGDTLRKFERTCRYDDNVLRSMVITVPEKKKGEAIEPIVPEPGYLANFTMEPRVMAPRRRGGYGRGPRPAGPDRGGDEPREEASPPAEEKAPSAENAEDKPVEGASVGAEEKTEE